MRLVVLGAALIGMGACAEPVEEQDEQEPTPLSPQETAESLPPQTMLVPGVIDESLRRDRNFMGELGCVFRRGGDTLFAAVANSVGLESAEGLVVLDEQPVEVELDGSGGYNSLQEGASFRGGNGLTVEIAVSQEAEIREEPGPVTGPAPMEATMILTRGGQELSVEGRYECGPQPDA